MPLNCRLTAPRLKVPTRPALGNILGHQGINLQSLAVCQGCLRAQRTRKGGKCKATQPSHPGFSPGAASPEAGLKGTPSPPPKLPSINAMMKQKMRPISRLLAGKGDLKEDGILFELTYPHTEVDRHTLFLQSFFFFISSKISLLPLLRNSSFLALIYLQISAALVTQKRKPSGERTRHGRSALVPIYPVSTVLIGHVIRCLPNLEFKSQQSRSIQDRSKCIPKSHFVYKLS